MTKTSIFGQSEVKQEEKKPIEFVKYFDGKNVFTTSSVPSRFSFITLLEESYYCNLDLMWAYTSSPNLGCLFLGHWNDGIVK